MPDNDGAGQGSGTGAGTSDANGTQGGNGAGQGSGDNGSQGNGTQGGDDLWEDGQPFDPERAKKTIEKLRNDLKSAPKKADYDALQAKVQEAERAKLSEKERAEAERDEARTRAEKLEADLRKDRAERAVERHATKLGFADPEDALAVLEREGKIEYDDDGKPKNVEALLKDLAKRKPHLLRGRGASAGTDAGAGKSGSGSGGTDMNALLRRAAGRGD